MRTPSATRVTRVAAESLGTLGIEYSMTSGRPRQIHGPRRDATASPAASDLGLGISDDSLILSPDEPAPRRSGVGMLKRDARARPGSAKRLAISASPSRLLDRHFRKASPAPAEWSAPRARGPPEDRYTVLERHIQHLEQQIGEHTRMGIDLRRDVFGKFGTVDGQMALVENKFSEMETALDAKVSEIDLKLCLLAQQLEKAEVQRPSDGRVVSDGFNKIKADLEALKQWSGTVFTKDMGLELEVMRQRGIKCETSLETVNIAMVHFQTLADGIGAAVVNQDGRIGGLESHIAQLTSSVESLRVFQEGQYPGPPPTIFSGGGFPAGGVGSTWGTASAGVHGKSFCGDYSARGAPGSCGGAPGSCGEAGHGRGGGCHCEHVTQLMNDSASLIRDVAALKARPGYDSSDPWTRPRLPAANTANPQAEEPGRVPNSGAARK